MKALLGTVALALLLPAGASERYPELQGAIARQSQRIARLEARIEALERRLPTGDVRVYRVDTAAGTIRCESCRFEESEEK